MGKMNMTFEEFMEKMYGGEKPEKLSQEDLDRLKGEMQQVAKRMKEEGVQPPPPGHEDVYLTARLGRRELRLKMRAGTERTHLW